MLALHGAGRVLGGTVIADFHQLHAVLRTQFGPATARTGMGNRRRQGSKHHHQAGKPGGEAVGWGGAFHRGAILAQGQRLTPPS